MNTKFYIIVPIIFLFYTSVGSSLEINSSLKITNSKLAANTEKALSGDLLSASKLFDHYAIYLNDTEEGIYWLMIGTENGSDEMAFNLGYQLLETDQNRAYFFIILAARQGNIDALEFVAKKNLDISTRNDRVIPSEVIKENIDYFHESALLGNSFAARKLAEYYIKDNNKTIINNIDRISDYSSYIYWYRIGAQNGDIVCMQEYCALLEKSKNKNDNLRSIFWGSKINSML